MNDNITNKKPKECDDCKYLSWVVKEGNIRKKYFCSLTGQFDLECKRKVIRRKKK